MKREGFQHGMVRTFRNEPTWLNPRPMTRLIDGRDSPATAGFFTSVSTKPTNHSKYTGKCGHARCTRCHTHPVSKSKGKAKGTQKLNSFDVVNNHRLVAWRPMEGRTGLNSKELSATAISDHLLNSFGGAEDYRDEIDEDVDESVEIYSRRGDDFGNSDKIDDDDDKFSFCNLGFDLDEVAGEDEDWCLVSDM